MAKRVSVQDSGLLKEFSAFNQPSVDESLDDLLVGDQSPKKDNFQTDGMTGAQMTPTSSSKPERPRTLKAGYDPDQEKLIVVFRDGTWWEYRNVPAEMWEAFRLAPSKGIYLRESGLDSWKENGPADINAMPRHRRIQMNAGLFGE
jgi:hypothetical protein